MKNFTRILLVAPALLLTAQLASAQTVYKSISLIGPAAIDWNTDAPLALASPTNVHQWVATLKMTAADCKFRANNDWTVNWGAPAFPTGTGTQNGANITVTTPGLYKVTFDDQTGIYAFTPTTALATTSAASTALALSLAPNPAHGALSVAYDLPAAATVSLSVRNSLGQLVRQLPAVQQAAGRQSQQLGQLNLAAGVYLVQFEAGAQRQTARLLVD